jgi:hypothetical protein
LSSWRFLEVEQDVAVKEKSYTKHGLLVTHKKVLA